MFGMTKSPVEVVTTGDDFVPRASLVATTVAPGMTQPCVSFTVPATEPVVICAQAVGVIAHNAMIARVRIFPPAFALINPPESIGQRANAGGRRHQTRNR